MFARFHPQKDHDTLICAAGMLLKRNPNVHFVLAGEGIDNSNIQLQDKISQEGIQNNFHLLGSRQDMPRLNAGMDIVTLSSSYGEALPMTLCEAMSCAIPCVATNVGDTATLIGNTGIVVEPKNPQALAHAWENTLELSDMEYNHLCYQARQRIREFYNLANMINQYKKIYHGSMGLGISR
jgi:glycosyltransferase involved in cell wall biosynthesis